MKKNARIICMVLVCSLLFAVPAQAASSVEPRESYFFSSYGTDLYKTSSTSFQIWFDVVANVLDNEIKPLGFANWNRPKGGYFVSLYAMDGTAKRTLALCKECGLEMTPAGATYPLGQDPHDSNIRIAPSFPTVEELEKAMDVFCTCLKVAALEKLINA